MGEVHFGAHPDKKIIGLSGAGTLEVGKNITAVTGATVSSKGVTAGANAALAAVAALG